MVSGLRKKRVSGPSLKTKVPIYTLKIRKQVSDVKRVCFE
jgi:hypothetical protein